MTDLYTPSSGAPAIPYSQEAEEAAIGAVLINPDSYYGLSAFLKEDDFYLLRHRLIWQALDRLAGRSQPIDYLTLVQELRDLNALNDIGGPAYLTQLMNNTPTSVHAEVYGRIVEGAATRRRLIAAADQIKSVAGMQDLTVQEVIAQSEAKLFDVTERQLTKELIPMREAMNMYYERIEQLMYNKDGALGVPSGFKDLDKLLGGLQKSDLLLFAGRPGMGKCVAAGTLVPTERGLVPIESLKPEGVQGIPDDEGGVYYPLEIGVQTPTGSGSTAYFYDSGLRETRIITTRAGYKLQGTLNHPVLVLSTLGEKVWKPLGELDQGDFVAVQRDGAIWGDRIELPSFDFVFYRSGFTSRPQLPTSITSELAYVLGLLTGDGNLTRKNYVSISSADQYILDTFYSWVASCGLSARWRAAYDHTVGSVVLNTWLENIGVSGYAHEKQIPNVILAAPKDCVCAFLQGLFDTDAHAEAKSGYIQFVTTSPVLARQVHTLLLQFGVIGKLTFKSNDYRGAWLIRITGDAARKFYRNIGFRLERKQARSNAIPEHSNSNLDVVPYLPPRQSSFPKKVNFTRYFRGEKSPSYPTLRQIAEYAPEVQNLLEPEFYWDVVSKVEEAGIAHCYDLTLPEGHAFITNGIVSHNTSFMLSAAVNMARLGARIAIFSMEMGIDQIVQRLVSMEAAINSQSLRLGQLTQQEWSRFVQVAGNMSNFRIFIDDTAALNPMQLRTKCLRMAREHGVDLVVVDYIQLMNSGGVYENNRVQEISYISRSMKELARELNVPVLSAAQLSRAVEQRQDKRPQLSDLRESGSLEQDADVVMFLYRDEVYNEATEFPNQAEIIIAKHRNGPTGTVNLYFEKTLTRFMNAAERSVDLSHL
ncbi:MAG TPA: replicative DNA helicase [Aggregatilineales bacterium]|nr:replicative DNA helicase [Aggregatilineales bacterium]